MKTRSLLLVGISLLGISRGFGDIGTISPLDAKKLMDVQEADRKPIVLDTRGGL